MKVGRAARGRGPAAGLFSPPPQPATAVAIVSGISVAVAADTANGDLLEYGQDGRTVLVQAFDLLELRCLDDCLDDAGLRP